ncbi:hypothetical protein HDE_10642 [Halotydeus destructor]|nr:hypothetical protein HDE_10642 [Halotydeus destructor]
MTSTNAFCIISQCLGQVKQTPIFLGRRRRDIDEDDVDADASMRSTDEDANIGDSYQSVETVEFIIHGKPERYIVANEVNVDINEPGDNEEEVDDMVDNGLTMA